MKGGSRGSAREPRVKSESSRLLPKTRVQNQKTRTRVREARSQRREDGQKFGGARRSRVEFQKPGSESEATHQIPGHRNKDTGTVRKVKETGNIKRQEKRDRGQQAGLAGPGAAV